MLEDILKVFGGIALLLFGIDTMSNSLKKIAGNKFKSIIEKTTNTPLKGILLGTAVTAVVQSSTGVTVLTVGLVRAGLMSLPQSVGIIMGANIGTTFTTLLMALPITEYGLAFLFVGVVLSFFSMKKVKYFGGVLVGLGMLFYGLELMDALKTLAEHPIAEDIFLAIGNNWFVGTIFGTLFTALIQSSTAFMGILIRLSEIDGQLGGDGNIIHTISLWGALPLILGSNIGTTFSSWIASIGGNAESKKTALVHVLFNIIGSILFLILLVPYYHLMLWMEANLFYNNRGMTIAAAHTVQNVVSTFILYFFIKQQIWLVNKLIKDKNPRIKRELVFNEALIDESPTLALELAQKGIKQMADVVLEYFVMVKDYSFANDSRVVDESEHLESIIDLFDEKIHDYLIKISAVGLGQVNSNQLSRNLDVTKDLERIGDHLNNLVELFAERYNQGSVLSAEGKTDLEEMYFVIEDMLLKTFDAYENSNKALAKEVLLIEDKVDSLEEMYRYKYIERLKSGTVPFVVSANYADILSNLERIADHLNNIAEAVIEPMRVPQAIYLNKR